MVGSLLQDRSVVSQRAEGSYLWLFLTGPRHSVSLSTCLILICLTLAVAICWARPQPPRPPEPDANRTAHHLTELRQRINDTTAVNTTSQRALGYSRSYLDKGERALQTRRVFVADRLIGAADALHHIAEHQQHLRTGPGPKGPPSPQEMNDHLQRVYFRTEQADYFLQQSHDMDAAAFPKWARDFYQLAVRASDRHDTVAADENAKCAEEVVRALEDLAQAASPPPPGPPPR
jgi:hypothetical protein